MDMLARHTIGSSHITGKGYVLYQWISILKKVNRLYANIEVPPLEEMKTSFRSATVQSLMKLEKLMKLLVFMMMISGMMMLQD
eukprot:9395079-Ditylum_brightwellii.AAC.1